MLKLALPVLRRTTVATAERLLDTQFFRFRHESTGATTNRAFTYSLPRSVADHVSGPVLAGSECCALLRWLVCAQVDFVSGVMRLPQVATDPHARRVRRVHSGADNGQGTRAHNSDPYQFTDPPLLHLKYKVWICFSAAVAAAASSLRSFAWLALELTSTAFSSTLWLCRFRTCRSTPTAPWPWPSFLTTRHDRLLSSFCVLTWSYVSFVVDAAES